MADEDFKKSPLYIVNEMAAFDRRDYEYYDKFTDEERKQFSTFLMLKWGANVGGIADLQAYYIMATNHNVNKNFFDLGRHPKLQWLMCTTVSPSMGKQYHYWLKSRKEKDDNTVKNKLKKIFPAMKLEDIEVMAEYVTDKDIKQYERDHGDKA